VRRAVVRRGIRCGPPVHGHARRCRVWAHMPGTFRRTDAKGTNHFLLTGRLRRHRLHGGTYLLVAQPRNRVGKLGHTAYARFVVTRG
jgi:hypothetical protein